jgi:hypothetical protein
MWKEDKRVEYVLSSAMSTRDYHIVGYFRPIDSWNPGKRQEYNDRHPLSLEELSPDLIDHPKEEPKIG